jgi:hypothetical protein
MGTEAIDCAVGELRHALRHLNSAAEALRTTSMVQATTLAVEDVADEVRQQVEDLTAMLRNPRPASTATP